MEEIAVRLSAYNINFAICWLMNKYLTNRTADALFIRHRNNVYISRIKVLRLYANFQLQELSTWTTQKQEKMKPKMIRVNLAVADVEQALR